MADDSYLRCNAELMKFSATPFATGPPIAVIRNKADLISRPSSGCTTFNPEATKFGRRAQTVGRRKVRPDDFGLLARLSLGPFVPRHCGSGAGDLSHHVLIVVVPHLLPLARSARRRC